MLTFTTFTLTFICLVRVFSALQTSVKNHHQQVLSDYVKKYQSNIYVFAQCQYHLLVTNAHNYQSSVWKNKKLAAFVYYCYDY